MLFLIKCTHPFISMFYFSNCLYKGPEDSKCVSEQGQQHQSWGFWNFKGDDNSGPSPNSARNTILHQSRNGKRWTSSLEVMS